MSCPLAPTILHGAVNLQGQNLLVFSLIQHVVEVHLPTAGARLILFLVWRDAVFTEMVSTAAGEMWISGNMSASLTEAVFRDCVFELACVSIDHTGTSITNNTGF